MEELLKSIQLKVNDKIYLADPAGSDLGKRILKSGSKLICEEGLDSFNFKKLSKEIKSTEAAIYRYFENKNKLLLYYFAWYWKWIEYNVVFGTQNLPTAKQKLEVILNILSNPPQIGNTFDYIDGDSVFKLMGRDGIRILLTPPESDDEKELIKAFKSLCDRVSIVINEVDESYNLPVQLATTIIVSTHLNKTLLPVVLDNLKDGELLNFWTYTCGRVLDSTK